MNAPVLRFRVLPAVPPIDARNIELRSHEGNVEWRLIGDEDWQFLFPLSDIVGPAGPPIELRVDDDEVQWRVQGTDDAWNTLTSLSAFVSAVEQAAQLAEAWATGSEPDGPGTKSAREWSIESGDSADLAQAWATGTNPDGLGSLSAREEADRAEAAAAGVNLPPINPGDAGKQLYVTDEEDGYRLDVPARGGGELFSTVAALLADDNDVIGYGGSGATVIVEPGDTVNAQGYRYEVAADDATDEDVETAGLVKANVLRNTDDSVSPLQFGAQFAGGDDTGPIQDAANFAAARGLVLRLPPGIAVVGEIETVGALRVVGSPGSVLRLATGAEFLWDFDGDGGLVRLDAVTIDGDDVTGMDHLCNFANGMAELLDCSAGAYNGTSSGSGSRPFSFMPSLLRCSVVRGEYHHMVCAQAISIRNPNSLVDGVHLHDLAFHGVRWGDGAVTVPWGRMVNCLVENFSQGGDGTAAADAGGSAALLEINSRDITVANNVVRNGRQIVKTDGSNRPLIIGNSGREPAGLVSGGAGIQIDGGTNDARVYNNNLFSYDQGVIILADSSRAHVQGNAIQAPGTYGVRVVDSTGAFITNNHIRSSTGYGIFFNNGSSNNIASFNNVTGSTTSNIQDNGSSNTVGQNPT